MRTIIRAWSEARLSAKLLLLGLVADFAHSVLVVLDLVWFGTLFFGGIAVMLLGFWAIYDYSYRADQEESDE